MGSVLLLGLCIVFIVFATARLRLHPFLALLVAASLAPDLDVIAFSAGIPYGARDAVSVISLSPSSTFLRRRSASAGRHGRILELRGDDTENRDQ